MFGKLVLHLSIIQRKLTRKLISINFFYQKLNQFCASSCNYGWNFDLSSWFWINRRITEAAWLASKQMKSEWSLKNLMASDFLVRYRNFIDSLSWKRWRNWLWILLWSFGSIQRKHLRKYTWFSEEKIVKIINPLINVFCRWLYSINFTDWLNIHRIHYISLLASKRILQRMKKLFHSQNCILQSFQEIVTEMESYHCRIVEISVFKLREMILKKKLI